MFLKLQIGHKGHNAIKLQIMCIRRITISTIFLDKDQYKIYMIVYGCIRS